MKREITMLCAALSPWLCMTAHAQSNSTPTAAITTQPLAQALEAFAKQTGLQIVYVSGMAIGATSKGAPDGLSPRETLMCLLKDTGLTFEFLNERTVRIFASASTGRSAAFAIPPDDSAGMASLETKCDPHDNDEKNRRAPMAKKRGLAARITGLSAVCASALHAGSACAQDAPVTERALEEVVVTATRREESMQKIPVTVTAITGDVLASSGILETRNLTQIVPGFIGSRNAGVGQPVIRGVGSSGISQTDESNVATYIDGVYQPDPYSTMLELVEIQRVEVLRGPQGTVFGRNATGGLINVITPDPQFSPRGKLAIRYGNMRNSANDYDVRGYITNGITDAIAADLAVLYKKNDAYIKDLVRGGTGQLGEQQVLDVRTKWLFVPREGDKIVLTAELADQDSHLNANQLFMNDTAGAQYPGVILPTGPWQSSLTNVPYLNYRRYNLALQTHFDLGSMNLETTTGYLDATVHQRQDSDSSNINLGLAGPDSQATSYNQEIRLLSNGDGSFDWLLGAYGYYMRNPSTITVETGTPSAITTTVFAPYATVESYSAFAEGTYELAPDTVYLTLGARYTTEKRQFRTARNGTPWAFGTAEKNFDKTTYRAALRYQFAPNANLYASYGTGFKSGVYNATLFTTSDATDPETINAAEIGLKADPLPGLRTNLSIYHYDYKGLQVTSRAVGSGVYLLQNAANAAIYGGEFEITTAPTRNLNIQGSIAYAHGEYKDFPLAQTFVPLPTGGNAVVAADVSGKQMIRSPRVTYNLGFNWSHDIGNNSMTISANAYRSGRVYYDFANNFSQKPYTMINAEIAYLFGENWRLSLSATNLTNAAVFQQIRVGPLSADGVLERPRRVSLGAEYKF